VHRKLFNFHKEFKTKVAYWKKNYNHVDCTNWCKNFSHRFYSCLSIHIELYRSISVFKTKYGGSCHDAHIHFTKIVQSTKLFLVKWGNTYANYGENLFFYKKFNATTIGTVAKDSCGGVKHYSGARHGCISSPYGRSLRRNSDKVVVFNTNHRGGKRFYNHY